MAAKKEKRPYFRFSNKELQREYEDNIQNKRVLRLLKAELAHRTTPSARKLALLVDASLKDPAAPPPLPVQASLIPNTPPRPPQQQRVRTLYSFVSEPQPKREPSAQKPAPAVTAAPKPAQIPERVIIDASVPRPNAVAEASITAHSAPAQKPAPSHSRRKILLICAAFLIFVILWTAFVCLYLWDPAVSPMYEILNDLRNALL